MSNYLSIIGTQTATAGSSGASASASMTGNVGTSQRRPQNNPSRQNQQGRPSRPTNFNATRRTRGGSDAAAQASIQHSQTIASVINAQQNAMLQDTQKRVSASG